MLPSYFEAFAKLDIERVMAGGLVAGGTCRFVKYRWLFSEQNGPNFASLEMFIPSSHGIDERITS